MGMFMTRPLTTKSSEDGGDFEENITRYGVSGMQGWRVSMEDSHIAIPKLTKNPDLSLYGVFDGHGGAVISEWISRHIESIFEEELNNVETELFNNTLKLPNHANQLPIKVVAISEALQRTYLSLDEQMALPISKPEQKAIYDNKKGTNENNKTFLQELLGSIDGQKKVLKVIGQNNNKSLQIISAPDNEQSNSILEEVSKIDNSQDKLSEDYKIQQNEQLESQTIDINTASEGIRPFESDIRHTNENNTVDVELGSDLDQLDELEDSEAYIDDSNDMGSCNPYHCGSTSVVAVISEFKLNDGQVKPYLIVANAGDSRAVLSRAGQAIALTHDHKPELFEENERILKANGAVENGRVDGNLNMSRTLGDLQYKSDPQLLPTQQKITAFPDVRIIPISKEDEFCILACDGIWDVVDNQLCVDIVRMKIIKTLSEKIKYDGSTPLPSIQTIKLSKLCEEICDECLAPNPVESEGIGCDNMTLMIVQFNSSLRDKGVDRLVSDKIGGLLAERLKAEESAYIEQSKLYSNDTNNIISSSNDETSNINNKKNPDAVLIDAEIPNIDWIPKKEFNIIKYGHGIDEGHSDNLPELKR